MNRKTFIRKTVGALLIAIPAYTLMSCSSSDDSGSNNPPNGNDPNCTQNGANASSITDNHGHSLTVSSADINDGSEKIYSIAGTSGHDHNVTVTSADFLTLTNNQSVVKSSTIGSGGHLHSVTISCA